MSLAFATTFGAGALSQRLLLREAHADPAPSTATLYVPASGLMFRSLDGTPIARLSRDAHGGVFEVYDDQQRAVRVQPGAVGTPASAAASRGADTTATLALDPGF